MHERTTCSVFMRHGRRDRLMCSQPWNGQWLSHTMGVYDWTRRGPLHVAIVHAAVQWLVARRLTATIASAITTATAFTAAALCKMLPAIDMARSGDGHLCKLLNLALQRCGEVRFLRGLRLRIR